MKRLRTVKHHLTFFTTITTFFLSISGLVSQNIYTDRINRITKYELMGQDFVTVIISAIFAYIILFKDYRRLKVTIVWLGCVLYLFYIYAYYSFGGISSVFYLLYIAVTGLTFFIFIFILVDIIKSHPPLNITKSYPRRVLSVFLFASIFLVAGIEIQELISKTIVFQERLNPFYIFYVLDLAIVFPMIIITSVLNLMKNYWGYLFSGVALIKIVTILPAVIFNDIFHRIYAGKFLDLPFDFIALVITLTAIILLIVYMKGIDDGKTDSQ